MLRARCVVLAMAVACSAPPVARVDPPPTIVRQTAMPGSAADFDVELSAPRPLAGATTTGAIEGTVTSKRTHEPINGATIAVWGHTRDEHATITDDQGHYDLDRLADDSYLLSIYYYDRKYDRAGVIVRAGHVTKVNIAITDP